MTDWPNILELSEACATAQATYRQGKIAEDTPCFKLLECAFKEGDERAWAEIYTIFMPQMRRWVEKRGIPPLLVDDLVQEAFLSLFRALPKRLVAGKVAFETTGHYMAYFKLCAHTTVLDYQRKIARQLLLGEETGTKSNVTVTKFILFGSEEGMEKNLRAEESSMTRPLEENILQRIFSQKLLIELEGVTKNAVEELVAKGSWVDSLKPEEVAAAYPDKVQGVKAVHKIKRNLLDRLRRRLYTAVETLCQTKAEQIVFKESWRGKKRSPIEILADYPDYFDDAKAVEVVKQRLLERLEQSL